ncbi:MAG TPA: hypothetical protein VGO58_18855 [Chitinophagaceae bacterium]|jgi:hypothetical protein|nr:hypothetical protein [Chitinophagaceae bacterium]
MTTAQPSTYGIPEVELPHIFKWLAYQSRIGSQVPFSDDSLFNYFGPFHGIVQSVNRIDNPVFEKIVTEFIKEAIGVIINTTTGKFDMEIANKTWTEMKMVCDYYHFLKTIPTAQVAPAGSVEIPYETYRFPWASYFNAFLGGYGYKAPDNTFYRLAAGYNKDYNSNEPLMLGELQTPGSKAISDLWGQTFLYQSMKFMETPPPTHIAKGMDISKKDETKTAQKTLVDNLNTTSQYPLNFVKAMETCQLTSVNELLKSTVNVTSEGYFMLYLLIMGLNTSNAADQALAKKIVKSPSGSDGYPNDIFINQLTYMSLLHMVNPAGPYKWTHDKLVGILNVVVGLNKRTDEAPVAIKMAAEKQLAALKNNPGYPLHDPQWSSEFNVRVTDTLAALEETRATLKPAT